MATSVRPSESPTQSPTTPYPSWNATNAANGNPISQ